MDLQPPPNGGSKAWIQVFMCWIVIFISWGFVNAYGTFQAYYITTLPQSQSAISWIGSIQVFLCYFTGAFSGRLLDAGYFPHTLVAGSLLQLLGIFLTSVATQYWQLLLTQGVLTGLGGGVLLTPAVTVVLTYFSTRRAIALGIVTTGNSLGGMIYPIITRELLPTLGFAWTMRLIGFIHLACFGVVIAFMRSRLPPRQTGPLIDWTAFRESVFVSYVAGLFCFQWATYYTIYYIGSFGIQVLRMPYTEAAYLVTIINGAGVPARFIIPMLADKYGPLNLLVPTGYGLSVIAFCWLAASDRVGLYAWTAFYGLLSGGFQSLMPTGVASITKRLDHLGTRLGMCFMVMSFAATGPPIGGAIQSAEGGGYRAAQIWAALSTVMCAVLLTLARIRKTGWALEEKC
ncbi:hypothetical protein S7711_08610 [Stachybotrys chartarum IBT 7711]|uniref:Major facilitator superfamily (MFS) profile domain-containing protein n=1 Tax=Stachybotrys chartarum (strain CBS 109288 / IBT 7711) TaxID=1280523 RepID=A0A084AWZ8_STACB|nr:hypothetical protein S7711_08610 [Stachybotrys chartarum IBT 7711]KFA49388.1 hypothetical protein S40293_09631 [Stachybotrys chartarum IBT 40293]